MTTLLVTPCYLDGLDGFGSDRLERNIKYCNWYLDLKTQGHLNFDKIVLLDNASDYKNIEKLDCNIYSDTFLCMRGQSKPVDLIRFDKHLPRLSNLDYPYCWRAIKFGTDLIRHYNPDKILWIDSDCFILNKELCNFINKKNDGWYSFYCRKHDCPEAAFHVLNKGSFDLFLKYVENCDKDIGKMMENVLPFTEVVTKYVGDRYSEYNAEIKQQPFMDYFAQAKVTDQFIFNPISPR